MINWPFNKKMNFCLMILAVIATLTAIKAYCDTSLKKEFTAAVRQLNNSVKQLKQFDSIINNHLQPNNTIMRDKNPSVASIDQSSSEWLLTINNLATQSGLTVNHLQPIHHSSSKQQTHIELQGSYRSLLKFLATTARLTDSVILLSIDINSDIANDLRIKLVFGFASTAKNEYASPARS